MPALDVTHLGEALASLTAQTATEVTVLVLDVSGGGDVRAVAAAHDVPCFPGEQGAGLVAHWRACFRLARLTHPNASLFAWGSDHDIWEPGWADGLRSALERDPAAVCAYPQVTHFGATSREPWRFEARERSRGHRFLRTLRGMVAGDMVYGVFRADALERCGVLRRVLLPDRLLFAELSLVGRLVQVDEVLWRRRMPERRESILDRQRRTLFVRPSVWTRLPWWLTHAGALLGARRPLAAVAYAILVPAIGVGRSATGTMRRRAR